MAKLTQADIVMSVIASTTEVFSTMLNMQAKAGRARVEKGAPGPTDGVVVLVGIAGPWSGTGCISCSSALACRLAEAFLQADKYEGVNDEVLDAMAEIGNMIVGNIKNRFEDKLGPMGLSIPTVVFGRNFATRSLATTEWNVVPFSAGGDNFDVHCCMAEKQEEAKAGFTRALSVA